ncbi:MAG: hypothetical protein IJS44_04125 [Clostridia bacterium]|nr:hypothetical protein [Clostridia bacterium]
MKSKLQTSLFALGIKAKDIRGRYNEMYHGNVGKSIISDALSGKANSETAQRIRSAAQSLVWDAQDI